MKTFKKPKLIKSLSAPNSEKVSDVAISVSFTKDNLTLAIGSGSMPVIYEREVAGLSGVTSALSLLVEELELRGSSFTLVLPPEAYELFLTTRPAVLEHELDDAMRWELAERAKKDAANSVVRCFDPHPILQNDMKPRIYSAMVPGEFLDEVGAIVLGTGLHLHDVQIADLSIARYLANISKGDISAAIVHGKGKGISVVQADGQFLLSRRFAYENQEELNTQATNSLLSTKIYLSRFCDRKISEVWQFCANKTDNDTAGADQISLSLPQNIELHSLAANIEPQSAYALGARLGPSWPTISSNSHITAVA